MQGQTSSRRGGYMAAIERKNWLLAPPSASRISRSSDGPFLRAGTTASNVHVQSHSLHHSSNAALRTSTSIHKTSRKARRTSKGLLSVPRSVPAPVLAPGVDAVDFATRGHTLRIELSKGYSAPSVLQPRHHAHRAPLLDLTGPLAPERMASLPRSLLAARAAVAVAVAKGPAHLARIAPPPLHDDDAHDGNKMERENEMEKELWKTSPPPPVPAWSKSKHISEEDGEIAEISASATQDKKQANPNPLPRSRKIEPGLSKTTSASASVASVDVAKHDVSPVVKQRTPSPPPQPTKCKYKAGAEAWYTQTLEALIESQPSEQGDLAHVLEQLLKIDVAASVEDLSARIVCPSEMAFVLPDNASPTSAPFAHKVDPITPTAAPGTPQPKTTAPAQIVSTSVVPPSASGEDAAPKPFARGSRMDKRPRTIDLTTPPPTPPPLAKSQATAQQQHAQQVLPLHSGLVGTPVSATPPAVHGDLNEQTPVHRQQQPQKSDTAPNGSQHMNLQSIPEAPSAQTSEAPPPPVPMSGVSAPGQTQREPSPPVPATASGRDLHNVRSDSLRRDHCDVSDGARAPSHESVLESGKEGTPEAEIARRAAAQNPMGPSLQGAASTDQSPVVVEQSSAGKSGSAPVDSKRSTSGNRQPLEGTPVTLLGLKKDGESTSAPTSEAPKLSQPALVIPPPDLKKESIAAPATSPQNISASATDPFFLGMNMRKTLYTSFLQDLLNSPEEPQEEVEEAKGSVKKAMAKKVLSPTITSKRSRPSSHITPGRVMVKKRMEQQLAKMRIRRASLSVLKEIEDNSKAPMMAPTMFKGQVPRREARIEPRKESHEETVRSIAHERPRRKAQRTNGPITIDISTDEDEDLVEEYDYMGQEEKQKPSTPRGKAKRKSAPPLLSVPTRVSPRKSIRSPKMTAAIAQRLVKVPEPSEGEVLMSGAIETASRPEGEAVPRPTARSPFGYRLLKFSDGLNENVYSPSMSSGDEEEDDGALTATLPVLRRVCSADRRKGVSHGSVFSLPDSVDELQMMVDRIEQQRSTPAQNGDSAEESMDLKTGNESFGTRYVQNLAGYSTDQEPSSAAQARPPPPKSFDLTAPVSLGRNEVSSSTQAPTMTTKPMELRNGRRVGAQHTKSTHEGNFSLITAGAASGQVTAQTSSGPTTSELSAKSLQARVCGEMIESMSDDAKKKVLQWAERDFSWFDKDKDIMEVVLCKSQVSCQRCAGADSSLGACDMSIVLKLWRDMTWRKVRRLRHVLGGGPTAA